MEPNQAPHELARLRTGSRVLVEVCTASLEDCLTSERGGADRIELNAGLWLGGLTPSLGLLQEVQRAVAIPVMCMIRPRPGGFCYSDHDFRVMQRDLELAIEHGADGVVLGVLTENGRVDLPRCQDLVRRAQGKTCVFHRAFDVTADASEAIEQLIELGFQRVMTSGQEQTAYNGSSRIAELFQQARGRIEILPAGGINGFCARDVIERTGCGQIHVSLRASQSDRSTALRSQVSFGGVLRAPEDRYDATDEAALGNLIRALVDPG